jgi:DNA-binding transcriptional LysR family regulator
MDLSARQIRAFVAVSETLSFTQASAMLHVSQPALTVQIRGLEETLKTRLFDRNSRSVALTQRGKELLPRLQRTLKELEAVVSDAHAQHAGKSGTVRIAALPSFAACQLPDVLLQCRDLMPAVQFVVRDAVAALVMTLVADEKVDLGITGGTVDPNEFEVLHEAEDRLCLVFPRQHPIARKRRIGIRDVARLPLVLTDLATSVRAAVDLAFARVGLRAQIRCETTNMMTAVAMVRAGLGVTILPAAARELRAEPTLASRPIDDPCCVRTVSLIAKRHRTLSPVGRRFAQVCIATMGPTLDPRPVPPVASRPALPAAPIG